MKAADIMQTTQHYRIRHLTTFHYADPVRESVMETRMHPRSEGPQLCLNFSLTMLPRAAARAYLDHLGNLVHYFDIPREHLRLTLTMEAVVQMRPWPATPAHLTDDAWAQIDAAASAIDFFDLLQPSTFAHPTPALEALRDELDLRRRDDPLTLLRDLNSALYNAFDYDTDSTHVDSPIDDALSVRRGVCQDFAHIMIALVRGLGMPCRYVSGYLAHGGAALPDRSAPDATHAWVEAWLPGLEWVGFDPTNNILCDEGRHIRVGVGRDYADVPPTRGIFKGETASELTVEVEVKRLENLPSELLSPTANAAAYSQGDGLHLTSAGTNHEQPDEPLITAQQQ